MAEDSKFEVQTFVKAVTALQDLLLKEEPMYGIIIVVDLKHFRLSDFMAFTPTLTKNMMKCLLVSVNSSCITIIKKRTCRGAGAHCWAYLLKRGWSAVVRKARRGLEICFA